jgi:cytochrome c
MKVKMMMIVLMVLAMAACKQGGEESASAPAEKAPMAPAAKPTIEAPIAPAESSAPAAPAAEQMASADGAGLYAPCAGCHGSKGEKPALGMSAVIAGQSEDDLLTKLRGYRDGTYGGNMKGSMQPMVANLSDEQLQAVAAYIAGF